MEILTPIWLDKSFLTLCLNGGEEKSDVEVSSFEVSSVLPPGNNYGSNLLRVKVNYKKNEEICNESLIIKFPSGYKEITKLFDKLFEKEPSFYNEYLPEALNITVDLPVPKSFYSPLPDVIVLNDLKEEGYKMADRRKMLDFDHCKQFMIASATFHAASFAVHKKRPETVESIAVDPLYSSELAQGCADMHKALMTNGLLCMVDRMERTEKYYKYANVVRKNAGIIWGKVIELHKRHPTFNVLQQADPWTPNMMFKYDETGNVIDIKLLDFQATRYGSPLCSLVFFLWTSANHDVRDSKLEELYHIYCDELNSKLKEFHCSECVSFEDLRAGINLLSPAILAISSYFFPSLTSPRVISIEQRFTAVAEGKVNPYEENYDDEYCKNSFLKLLGQLERTGVFDSIECL
ncbi:uncharacterized protein LOC124356343 [Homalodisca vitripennis]|uniref:uncharacterized protein LOC124356343 n=1 Tax=Homalodisca vitripennis TaxID=197043 RepID=UPI001EEB0541|nr:uncharacterized protein LOC124356343 [Homalodisca vitripennis]